MSLFLDVLKERVIIFDGAMGTSLHAYNLPLADYQGLENCSEILVMTRPDVIQAIHERYLAVGCDAVETNTFGANKVVFAEFGLVDRVREINRRAAELAVESCRRYSTPEQPRFAVGSIGPGTKLPSLRHTDFDTLEDSYAEQVRGLLEGGADVLLIETCQDVLQSKAAIAAAERVFAERGRRVPLMVQVTMETTGTMLVGTDIGAAMNILECFDADVIGINCATGPQEMSEHVSYLGRHCRKPVSVLPNAGLPYLADGNTMYPLKPAELALWLERFVVEDGVNIVGGCCGTTPEHLQAVVERIGRRPPKTRRPDWEPSVSSLYGRVPIRQDASVLIVGERTNANGSRRFKRLLAEENWDEIVSMAREQVKDGSHLLDVCTAYVGRDETRDMSEVISRLSTQVSVPLMLDSTEWPVLETALKLCGGKCIVNSINFEDGEERLARVLPLCKKYGAAVVALTIDEQGMAKTWERKLEVARRLYEVSTRKYRMAPSDLLFDPLTFTICTGNEDDRALGWHTLEALERITAEFPECHTLLGLSNISFGINAEARHVLNSVFLHHARQRGLTSAIVHAAAITPFFKIPEEERQVAEDLIFDRRRDGYDPLHRLLELFSGSTRRETVAATNQTIEERLKNRIVDGNRVGLEKDLEEALQGYGPLQIINEILLDGMKVVGDLFGSGQMQLPFVLQSAETMKASVAFLEPYMEKKTQGVSKGRIVLATVRGDVHDIGKNLVDIILTNNGYTVFNLGIKQPIHSILEAAQREHADAIGMSGLLVKSTVIMRENLEEMNRQQVHFPVLLGGAALTRKYVENDCRALYHGKVYYAKDAFEGLHLMDALCASGRAAETGAQAADAAGAESVVQTEAAAVAIPPASSRPVPDSDTQRLIEPLQPAGVPAVPFWGPRVLESIPLRAVLPFINETLLFNFQWGYRKTGKTAAEYETQLREVVRPRYRELVSRCEEERILQPRAVYGFYRCQSDGDDLVLYDQSGGVLLRYTFPRQNKAPYRCLSDYFRSVGSGVMDVVALQVVTVGQKASDTARAWFAANRYTDYLHLHGLSVEAAEALAEYVHKQVRADLGMAAEDERDIKKVLKGGYRGCRYSFGYPACPRLEDQEPLLALLEAGRIGVTLGDEWQLWPEQSTSALVVHHPQATYYSV